MRLPRFYLNQIEHIPRQIVRQVYLDHAATTPLDPRVLDAMRPFLEEHFGNASSVHGPGRRARFAVEEAREKVAACLGAEPGEVVFTSGGTEANNTVLRGFVGGVVTSAAEHESVLRPANAARDAGRDVTILVPRADGAADPSLIADHLGAGHTLVSIMHGNNELGTLSDVREIASRCRREGAVFHCDAVQTAGYGLLRVDRIDVDLMTVSAHKFYGPKGAGVLFMRGGVEASPLLLGGAQERGRRGGTENVAAVVGMAAALELAVDDAEGRRRHAEGMRLRLLSGLMEAVGEHVVVNTPVGEVPVAPHILNVAFPPFDGEAFDGEMLLLNLDMEGVYASAGSACSSGAVEPSHVLKAIGLDRHTASAAIRFSVGKDTSEDDVDYAVAAMDRVVRRMIGARAAT